MESYLKNWCFWRSEESGQKAGAGNSAGGDGRYILTGVCPKEGLNIKLFNFFSFFITCKPHSWSSGSWHWAPPGPRCTSRTSRTLCCCFCCRCFSISLLCLCFLFGPGQETDWRRILVCRGLFRGSQGTRPLPHLILVRVTQFSDLIGGKCHNEGSLWFTH